MRGLSLAVLTCCLAAVSMPAAAKQEPPLRFATYNVCKTACGTGEFSWDNRKAAVVRNIRSARPDVVAVQEVDNSYRWLAKRLQRHGYAMVAGVRDDCIDSASCIEDSRLFYRSARVRPLVTQSPSQPVTRPCRPFIGDNGELLSEPVKPAVPEEPTRASYPSRRDYQAAHESWTRQYQPSLDAYRVAVQQYFDAMQQFRRVDELYECSRFIGRGPVSDDGNGSTSWATIGRKSLHDSVNNRNFAWAVLRDRRTGGAFIAVSMHMPNEKTPQAEQYRRNLARRLVSSVDSMAASWQIAAAPTILMGDFNSYWQRQPRGVQWIFARAGFEDAYAAQARLNDDVPTVNITSSQRDPFPARPFRFDSPARLDYVMFDKGRALRYEVHLRLKDGLFDDRFRGSDHNLVLADLRLPRVAVGARWVPVG